MIPLPHAPKISQPSCCEPLFLTQHINTDHSSQSTFLHIPQPSHLYFSFSGQAKARYLWFISDRSSSKQRRNETRNDMRIEWKPWAGYCYRYYYLRTVVAIKALIPSSILSLRIPSFLSPTPLPFLHPSPPSHQKNPPDPAPPQPSTYRELPSLLAYIYIYIELLLYRKYWLVAGKIDFCKSMGIYVLYVDTGVAEGLRDACL